MEKNIGVGIKKTILGVLLISIVVFSITFTYSFFIKNIDQSKGMSASLKTGNMALTFEDNDNGINKQLSFGETVIKKFKIINTGTLDASLSLDWNMLVNTYLNRSLSYNLKYSTEENGTYEEIVPETNMPTSTTPIKQALASELTVPSGTTYYYNLEITLNDLEDVEQSDDLDAVFNTKFDIGEPSKYRYYRLTIDTNGGSFEEEIQKEYLLKNEETVSISNTPTRPGYTFAGWKVQGLSSKFVDGTFTMGISDTYMIAEWTPNIYSVGILENCIDPSGLESAINVDRINYGSSSSLGKPPVCEGYTFTGWNVTEGTGRVEGNNTDGYTFTLTEPGNATVEAQWTPNNYKYIVYHNQMNVDGNGYTLVSADTDEGEAAFNTTVTPPTKEYQGFTPPSTETLTIKHETVYPPVLNKVEYNYERNKYTVTINTNGGTYEGETEKRAYYKSIINLVSINNLPRKTGYRLTGWNVTSGTILEPIEVMDCEMVDSDVPDNCFYRFVVPSTDAEITAQWTARRYYITFNANGGSTTTESKTVTYDTAYGELPTPTYEGYTFEGWYTEANGGTKVTSTTMYTTADNTTLYAHWRKIVFNVPEAVVAIKNSQTPKAVNGTKTSFDTLATTDEGVFEMADDYGTSYYYRGAVTNNYVKFGGFYWRIIRINGDGSVRMIYDGTKAHTNGETGQENDRFIQTGIAYNASYNDNAYVGWKYGTAGSSTYAATHTVSKSSTEAPIKKNVVDPWYKTNIADKNLGQYVGDEIFCNDRSMPGTSGWSSDTKKGFGTNATGYGALSRLVDASSWVPKTNAQPKLTCTNKNDAFTVSDTTKGNGSLTYPVGLITADEIVAAGAKYYKSDGTSNNTSYYLYRNKWYWSLSPSHMYTGGSARVFDVASSGDLYYADVNYPNGAVAPVINLSAEASATLVGEGTTTTPYQIPGVN